jgi:branched-subunit amino acid aminotransferase/4-amino-4-deoxychorismate lyase
VEAILPDDDDRLIEGTRSNLLAVVDGGLIAPGSESYALPGITRGVALEEARALGLAVEERAIGREELPEVTELLLTSSLMGIVSVAWVERAWSRTGASRAPVGSRLRRSYAARVRAQVRSFRR